MRSKSTGMSDNAVPNGTADVLDNLKSSSAPTDDTNFEAPAADSEQSFDDSLRAALRDERISAARTLVADAEAVLNAHEASQKDDAQRVTRSGLAAAKARIAMASGDGAAAHAILLQALERAPKADKLRTLMTEVMLATGRATDVRPVLKHLPPGTSGGNQVESGARGRTRGSSS